MSRNFLELTIRGHIFSYSRQACGFSITFLVIRAHGPYCGSFTIAPQSIKKLYRWVFLKRTKS